MHAAVSGWPVRASKPAVPRHLLPCCFAHRFTVLNATPVFPTSIAYASFTHLKIASTSRGVAGTQCGPTTKVAAAMGLQNY